MAREWCEQWSSISEERHPADWDAYGKSAGYRRNAEMVSLGADLCIAFVVPGKSKGTQHTIDLARKAGIEVQEVFQDG